MNTKAIVIAGLPLVNHSIYHRTHFKAVDPTAYIEVHSEGQPPIRQMISPPLELERAKLLKTIDRVNVAIDFEPTGGFSSDPETMLAQAIVQCLKQYNVTQVVGDRTLSLIMTHHITEAGIKLTYDPDLGVTDRRVKSDQEIQYLQQAQSVTEQAMRFACEMIANASPDANGLLQQDGEPLTSERVKHQVNLFLMERGYTNANGIIIATTPHTADCHHMGTGPLRTGEPVICDIFPRNEQTRYWGDCTRTVVHGSPSDQLIAMHKAVVEAKSKATEICQPGSTGDAVHQTTIAVLTGHGFHIGPLPDDAPDEYITMHHGTGHGIGLDVHEPIRLHINGPTILAGEALTIEPGLYSKAFGGVRVEDMVITSNNGCINLNKLHQGIDWK